MGARPLTETRSNKRKGPLELTELKQRVPQGSAKLIPLLPDASPYDDAGWVIQRQERDEPARKSVGVLRPQLGITAASGLSEPIQRRP